MQWNQLFGEVIPIGGDQRSSMQELLALAS
jgi:hypothetical protein